MFILISALLFGLLFGFMIWKGQSYFDGDVIKYACAGMFVGVVIAIIVITICGSAFQGAETFVTSEDTYELIPLTDGAGQYLHLSDHNGCNYLYRIVNSEGKIIYQIPIDHCTIISSDTPKLIVRQLEYANGWARFFAPKPLPQYYFYIPEGSITLS